jgi:hypothetical protein
MAAFPRVYRSFADFERDELRKLDSLRTTVDDMLDEAFSDELDFGEDAPAGGRGSTSKRGSRRPVALDESWD